MESVTIDQAAAAPALASFTIDAKAFADAVKFLAARVVERRNRVPIASCVLIRADIAGTVTISATDFDILAALTVPAQVESPGEFAADAAALADILTKARKDASAWRGVTVTDGDGRATIKAGRGVYNVPRLPADDFPLIDAPEPLPVAFTLPAARFLADLAALAPCVSKKEARYYLNGVAIQVRDLAGRERLAMVATDGHAMGIASRDLPAGAEGLPDALLPRKACEVLRHAGKLQADAATLSAEFDPARGGGLFRFGLGAVTITAKAIDGTFPDWCRPWDAHLAPTGEPAPLFPELLPAAPLGAMERIGKATGAAMVWEPSANGMIGTLPDDTGMIFGCVALAAASREPVKGYRFGHERADESAMRYLRGLAKDRCEVTANGENSHLMVQGGQYLGLTVGNWETVAGHYAERQNWETLHVEKVWIDPVRVYETGACSVLIPRERAVRETDCGLMIEGDSSRYPLAQNNAGAIHLTKDQVRSLIGESCFETMPVTLPNGTAAFVLRWLWEQGDSRFLTVRKDGRTFPGGVYVTRAEIEGGAVAEAPAEIAPVPAPVEAAQSVSEPEPYQDAPSEEIAPQAAPEPKIAPVAEAEPVTDAIEARLAALEAAVAALAERPEPVAVLPAEPAPIAEPARPKRTAAHERAVRRAWAERKARRDAAALLETERAHYEAAHADAVTAETCARAAEARERQALEQLASARESVERWKSEAVASEARERMATAKRRRAVIDARRARRMIAAARTATAAQAGRADMAIAELSKLKRDLADPMQPERASDLAQLVRERDQARTALAAVEARNARMATETANLAEAYEAMVSRLTRAEAAVRRMLPAEAGNGATRVA